MTNMIDRYIHEVVSRLPEKDRADVSMELSANIYDMLPDSAGEAEINEVLNSLGDPAALAEKYRSKPRYLISPSVYDSYIRTLKYVLPLVGGICLIVGAIFGAIETLGEQLGEMVPLTDVVVNVIVDGLSAGIGGAFQALFWVTVGFVIAERTGTKQATTAEKWTVEKLPDNIPNDKARIPLSDSIAELIIIVIVTIIALLFCFDRLPFIFMLSGDTVQAFTIFSDSFLAVCIPVIIIGSLLSIAECVVKIVQRRWTPLVCATIVISGVVCVVLMLYLFTQPQIINPEFASLANEQGWIPFDLATINEGLSATVPLASMNPILLVISVIVIICTAAECIYAVYRTIRARHSA